MHSAESLQLFGFSARYILETMPFEGTQALGSAGKKYTKKGEHGTNGSICIIIIHEHHMQCTRTDTTASTSLSKLLQRLVGLGISEPANGS